MLDQLASVEGHQQAFARALGMPDHACALVPGTLCLDTGQTVPGGIFGHALNDPCSPNRGSHRMAYCMELVIARNDLGKPRPRLGKHGETANQLKQAAVLKHPFDQRGKFRFLPSVVRHGMKRSRSAESEPTRAPIPSEVTSSALV